MSSDHDCSLDGCCLCLRDLGTDERTIAKMMVDRLRVGQERYGEWVGGLESRDPLALLSEAGEEALDFGWYILMRCYLKELMKP